MTDQLKEQLSAMVDDQLPEQEQELLIARLTRDKDLVDCWRRYHLISDGIRRQLPENPSCTVADRVREALADEPPLTGPSHRGGPAWMKPLAGLAVAASVAVVAILGVRTMQVGSTPDLVASTTPVQQQVDVPHELVRLQGVRWNVSKPRVADQLNSYLVDHSEYAASGMPGIGPHARIVGYDTSR